MKLFLIDGSNVHAACKALGAQIDWKKFRDFHLVQGNVRCKFNYYTALYTDDAGFTALKPLVDWLSLNGYHVVKKEAKKYINSNGPDRIKGNMDIEIVTDMFTLAPYVTEIVLYSGDNDFVYAVDQMQRLGKHVTVVSTMGGQHSGSLIGEDLRRQADRFIDMHSEIQYYEKKQEAVA